MKLLKRLKKLHAAKPKPQLVSRFDTEQSLQYFHDEEEEEEQFFVIYK